MVIGARIAGVSKAERKEKSFSSKYTIKRES